MKAFRNSFKKRGRLISNTELKPFQAVYSELEEARKLVTVFESSTDKAEVEIAWNRFVTLIQTAWTSFKDHGEKLSPKFQSWFGVVNKKRDQDELLKYLYHSRCVAQHAFLHVEWSKQKIHVGPPAVGVGLYRNMKIFSDGTNEVEFEGFAGDQDPNVVIDLGGPILPRVCNRGVWHSAPSYHNGLLLPDTRLSTAANLALDYYLSVVDGAAEKIQNQTW